MMRYAAASTFGLTDLFHYQSFNAAYLREVIVDGVIHFSKPTDFNDPWDCKPWFDYSGLKDAAIFEAHLEYFANAARKTQLRDTVAKIKARCRANHSLLADLIRQFSDQLSESIATQYRVYFLSTKPDCELMWAHYAAKHQGICLEFSARNALLCSAFQVQYSHSYPLLQITGFAEPEEHLAPLLIKSAAWSYENEFRLISDERGDSRRTLVSVLGKMPIPKGSLKAVILGCLAPDSTKQAVADMVAASPHKPQMKFATRMKDQYQLQIS